MTAVSLSVYRGALLNQNVSSIGEGGFVVGTSAPGAGDVEVRFNLTDQNSNNLTRADVVFALRGAIWLLENTHGNAAGGLITNLGI
jgi:hypothetical protein